MTSLVHFLMAYPVLTLASLVMLDTAFGIVPVEITIVYGIETNLSPIEIGLIGTIFTILGALIDYVIGMKGLRLLFHPSKEEIARGNDFFEKYGVLSLFAVRLIPFFPVKPISVVAGSLGYSVITFSAYTGLGAFFRFFLEALVLDQWYVRNKGTVDVLLRGAYAHATNPANYILSIFFIVAGVAIFYYLVMRNQKRAKP